MEYLVSRGFTRAVKAFEVESGVIAAEGGSMERVWVEHKAR